MSFLPNVIEREGREQGARGGRGGAHGQWGEQAKREKRGVARRVGGKSTRGVGAVGMLLPFQVLGELGDYKDVVASLLCREEMSSFASKVWL